MVTGGFRAQSPGSSENRAPWDQVISQIAGQQLAVCVIDEVLEEGAAQSLDNAADRLAVQCQWVDDAGYFGRVAARLSEERNA